MKKLKLTQAFTIIELTAVMVIIMILASLIMGVGRRARIAAMETKAQAMIASLEVAISMYHTDTGSYPPDSDAVPPPATNTPSAVLYDRLTNTNYGDGVGTDDIDGWRGPYMEFKGNDVNSGEIIDPWGNAYKYDSTSPPNNANSFDLWSMGADGKSTTVTEKEDDITNW